MGIRVNNIGQKIGIATPVRLPAPVTTADVPTMDALRDSLASLCDALITAGLADAGPTVIDASPTSVVGGETVTVNGYYLNTFVRLVLMDQNTGDTETLTTTVSNQGTTLTFVAPDKAAGGPPWVVLGYYVGTAGEEYEITVGQLTYTA